MLAPLGEWHEQGRHWHRLTLTGKDSTTTITGAIDVREVGLDPTFRLRIDAPSHPRRGGDSPESGGVQVKRPSPAIFRHQLRGV